MKIKKFTINSLPIDENSSKFAEEIASLLDVEHIVLLPDCYTKDKYINLNYKISVPSSSVIVTDGDVLYPQFRCRGINCGMMLIALPISSDNLSKEFSQRLLSSLTYDPLYYLLYRMRLPFYSKKEDITKNNLKEILLGDTNTPEDFNNLINSEWLSKRTVRLTRGVGRYFGGNHYFELQVAKNSNDNLGIKSGQILAMYHTGCQGLTPLINQNLVNKYIYKDEYVSVRSGSDMYRAFFLAQSMLERYTNFYREQVKNIVDDVLNECGLASSRTILNKGHNNVTKEVFDGSEKLIYRHNSEFLKNGDHAIVSGSYNHESYVVEGLENIKTNFNTIDHGLGYLINMDRNKIDLLDKMVSMYSYRNGINIFKKHSLKPLVKSNFVSQYFKLLEDEKVAKKALTLEPLINIKYKK